VSQTWVVKQRKIEVKETRANEVEKTTETEAKTITRTETSTSAANKSLCPLSFCSLLNLRPNDIPIIIVVACLAFIFISVFFMKKPSK
jgi:hypothetical protein